MAIAANANPTNQDGNVSRNKAGTAKFAPYCLKPAAYTGLLPTPEARAMYPRAAMSASKNEYAGSIAVLRLMTSRLLELSTPVIECG